MTSDIHHAFSILAKSELVALSEGNVSYRISDDAFVVSPPSIPWSELTLSNFATVKISNSEILDQVPSSEWKLHHTIYSYFSDCQAILHTHPIYTTAMGSKFYIPYGENGKLITSTWTEYIAGHGNEYHNQFTYDDYIHESYGAKILTDHGLVVWSDNPMPDIIGLIDQSLYIEKLAKYHFLKKQVQSWQ